MMKIRSRILAATSLCLLYLNAGSVAMAGTLLPPGEQYFTDNNGLPLSAGCVAFYIPGTLTPKATYADSSQTISNTNPVQLDAAGRAVIYGTGTYRQIVKSTGPNPSTPCSPAGAQIWDQLTASSDATTTIYAGASSGTPNAITVTAAAFSGSDGQVVNYISTNTNTGAATFNPSGFGSVQIVRDSSIGPQALTGGELVATNAVSLIYDATAGTFHILSPITWPNTSGVPVGTTITVRGFTAPAGYAFTYGQAISRTTYSALFSVLTLAQNGSMTSGSPTITGIADITQLGAGQPVEAIGIPASTTIVSCAVTSCTLSANATSTRSGTITFFAYGNGDGSTTFNLPDDRGVYMAGRTNMGGSASTNLTSTYLGVSPTQLGAIGGLQSTILVTLNLPPYTPIGTVAIGTLGGTTPYVFTTPGTNVGYGGAATGAQSETLATALNGVGAFTFTGTAQGGNSTPFSRIPPTSIINYAIRLVP